MEEVYRVFAPQMTEGKQLVRTVLGAFLISLGCKRENQGFFRSSAEVCQGFDFYRSRFAEWYQTSVYLRALSGDPPGYLSSTLTHHARTSLEDLAGSRRNEFRKAINFEDYDIEMSERRKTMEAILEESVRGPLNALLELEHLKDRIREQYPTNLTSEFIVTKMGWELQGL